MDFSRVEVSGSDFAQNFLRELIPLLFRCYSAVNSPVIPLLIPLLIPRSCGVNSSQIPESAHVFAKDSPKTAVSNFFFAVNSGIGLPTDPKMSTASSRLSGAEHVQKTCLMLTTAMRFRGLDPGTGMTSGGSDSVVLGRRLTRRGQGWEETLQQPVPSPQEAGSGEPRAALPLRRGTWHMRGVCRAPQILPRRAVDPWCDG